MYGNPYRNGRLPRGQELRDAASDTAECYQRVAEYDPDAGDREWFIHEVMKAISEGRIGWMT